MALYIPAGRRRRRLVLTAVGGLVAGLLLGVALGRLTATNAAADAIAAKQAAGRVTGQLRAFPVHYDEAARGQIDRAGYKVSLNAGLGLADEVLVVAMDRAAWIEPAGRDQLRRQISGLRDLAARDGAADEFETATNNAIATINSAFGIAR